MERNLIQEVVTRTMFLAVAVFLVSAPFTLGLGIGVFAGALWGCINLVLIKHVMQNFLKLSDRKYIKLFLLLCVKFPLLYFMAYYLLSLNYFSPWSFLLGFMSLLLVIFFRGIKIGMQISTCVAVALLSFTELHASLDAEIPEVPNIFTFIVKFFEASPWAAVLHEWESIIFSLIAASSLSFIFYLGTKKAALIPEGLQNFLEWITEHLENFIVSVLGNEGKKFVPFLGTIFIYILTMNWFVLIPFMKAPSSNFNITAAMAICVFVLVQYLNIKNYGIRGFLYHMAGSPQNALGWALVPLILPIELITQITRPITLALRLFGNVVGEDILIGAFALFGVVMLASYLEPFGLPLQIPFMFFALLTSLMQALVFTLLSSIYILLSMPHHSEDTASHNED